MDNISRTRLEEAVHAFNSAKILVVGDVMLDHYIYGDSERISPEAPVPVVKVERDVYHLGGAANVAKNITALGASATLSGLMGRDEPGRILRSLLDSAQIDWRGYEDHSRPTIQKVRIVARGQQLLRIDREEIEKEVRQETLQGLHTAIKEAAEGATCIVISDYAKGTLERSIIESLKGASGTSSVPIIVDPKPKNMHLYKGVDLMTPNRKEAEEMARSVGIECELDAAMGQLKDHLLLKALIVTLGEKGMAILEGDGHPFYLPTMAREVFDVTGAGDTVIALLGLGLSVGLDLKEAGCLANIGAGIVVGKIGTASFGREELLEGVARAFE